MTLHEAATALLDAMGQQYADRLLFRVRPQIESLRAALESDQDARDAARWRYVRDRFKGEPSVTDYDDPIIFFAEADNPGGRAFLSTPFHLGLDAAIDAAMEKE